MSLAQNQTVFSFYNNPRIFWGHYFHDAFDIAIIKSGNKLITEALEWISGENQDETDESVSGKAGHERRLSYIFLDKASIIDSYKLFISDILSKKVDDITLAPAIHAPFQDLPARLCMEDRSGEEAGNRKGSEGGFLEA